MISHIKKIHLINLEGIKLPGSQVSTDDVDDIYLFGSRKGIYFKITFQKVLKFF